MELDGQRRTLHPLDIQTEGEELTCSIALCVPLPQTKKAEGTEPGIMEVLHMDI
jgi:hypothetical protein